MSTVLVTTSTHSTGANEMTPTREEIERALECLKDSTFIYQKDYLTMYDTLISCLEAQLNALPPAPKENE